MYQMPPLEALEWGGGGFNGLRRGGGGGGGPPPPLFFFFFFFFSLSVFSVWSVDSPFLGPPQPPPAGQNRWAVYS